MKGVRRLFILFVGFVGLGSCTAVPNIPTTVVTVVATPTLAAVQPTDTAVSTIAPLPTLPSPTAVLPAYPAPDDLYLPPTELASPSTRTPIPTPTPYALSTQPPPAGLIYGDSNGLWKVIRDGSLQRLWTQGNVTLSPDGQRALYQHEDELKIADFAIGKVSDLDLSFFNQWCCAVWGGNEMILLGTLPEGEEWRQSFGYLTAVAADGSWQRVLDSENKYGTYPALSPDGRTIAYGLAHLVQLDGQITVFDPAQFAGFPNVADIGLGSPAWSPDGTKLAWYIAGSIGEDGRYAAAVAVFDLEAETAVIIHTYENLGRDGWFDAPVWSPDGQWLAFNVEASDLSKNGLWVAAADGSEEHFLGRLGGKALVWSRDGRRLVYSVWDSSKEQGVVLMAEIETWTAVQLDLPADAVILHWAADGLPAVPPPPQVYCPNPETDEMVGTLVKHGPDSVYTNPVLGIEITSADKLCVYEPDYLFASYGFTLADPDVWEGVLFSVDWLYQAVPDELETIVQQTIDSYPDLEINRETVIVDGIQGVMLWPLPGTDTTTQIYLAAQDRLYHLIFWSAPLDDRAQTLLDGLRFVEPTQSLDSLRLPVADSAAIQSGAPILFLRDNDLWRADINGQNEQRLTEGQLLANWFASNEAGDPWWVGGFPPDIHISPNGRWLAFTQTGRNLVVVDVTGKAPVRFHDVAGWAMIFTWSPDSQRLAYSIQPHFMLTRNQAGIYTYDVVTGQSERLLSQDGGDLVWSPDGRFLAFSCCFSTNSDVEPAPGEVQQVELATGRVTTVGETWIGVASGPPPICWSADGSVGIEVAEPVVCSYGRPYPHGISPDGTQRAYLSLQSPDDEDYFRLLIVKDMATDAVLWQHEVPLVQKVYWSPDGQQLLLGSDYFAPEAAIYRIPANDSGNAELLLSNALLLDVAASWQ